MANTYFARDGEWVTNKAEKVGVSQSGHTPNSTKQISCPFCENRGNYMFCSTNLYCSCERHLGGLELADVSTPMALHRFLHLYQVQEVGRRTQPKQK